jgi:tRNA-2-methylthio-N6-dimethylallyladenosine synthase
MPNQVSEEVKEERNKNLLRVVDACAGRINARLVGRTVEVLCEGPSKTNSSRLTGRTRTNKIVNFEGAAHLVGTFVDLRIERATAFSLYGSPANIPTSLAGCAS